MPDAVKLYDHAGNPIDVLEVSLTSSGTIDIGDVTLLAGEAHAGQVGGHSDTVLASFTRPNDTNAYAAGDVVANSTSAPVVLTFTGCARVNGGTGVLVGATLIDGANVATKGSFELWVFDTSPTIDNDNALFTPTDAELQTLVAIFVFTTAYIGDATVGIGGNAVYVAAPQATAAFNCAGGSTALYGVLIVRNAYVPVAQETFAARLRVLSD